MTTVKPPDSGKPTVVREEKTPPIPIPMVPTVPEKLEGIVWDKIGTFTIKTIIPDDDR
jgi:hypothetical protein